MMETNDVCMREPEKLNIERRERKNMLKRNIGNKDVQISNRLNDTHSERKCRV